VAKEKLKYEKKYNHNLKNIDNRVIRYRDWENLKYWFRGVETFAPWVNKVYFITYGHIP
jgi:cytosine/uracil/thiamine/allantoin permease